MSQRHYQRRSQAEWEELVRACARSGVSATRFARSKGVNVSSLLGWRSRLGKLPSVEASPSAAPRLVELVRREEVAATPGVAHGGGQSSPPVGAVRVQLGSIVVVFDAMPPPHYLSALATAYGAGAP